MQATFPLWNPQGSGESIPKGKAQSIPVGHLPAGICGDNCFMSEEKFEIRRKRLIQLRDDACNGSSAELSRRIGKDATYVSRLLYPPGKTGKKNITERMQEAIESAFCLPKDWLDGSLSNVEPGPSLRKQVPVISWVSAGSWCDADDPYQLGDADSWEDCPYDHSERAVCLRVVGDSMHPEYREGELILVDPAIEARHGDDVIARTPEGKATFKRLQVTPDGTFLIALNPSYPDRIIKAPADTHICGVVTASWMQRRKR